MTAAFSKIFREMSYHYLMGLQSW